MAQATNPIRPEGAPSNTAGQGAGPRYDGRPAKQYLRLLTPVTSRQAAYYGVAGAFLFFLIWEAGHYLTPEGSQRFLPSPQIVVGTMVRLTVEKNYLADVGISLARVLISFFAACAIAVPLGVFMGCFANMRAVFMGCFANMRAFINPVFSGARYLPAASFIPLLLVWFGPTDTQKLALLFLGVIFFLVALILDNTEAVEKSLVEAALTMGASRSQIVMGVVVRAASPAIVSWGSWCVRPPRRSWIPCAT
jgi:NitT/TauT family transport system permease protein